MEWETGKIKGFSGKNLINLENGSLKKVKVNPFSKYPSHLHHNKTEFIYVLDGNPTITIGQNNYKGEKDDFFILPNSIKHSIENLTDSECFLIVGAVNI